MSAPVPITVTLPLAEFERLKALDRPRPFISSKVQANLVIDAIERRINARRLTRTPEVVEIVGIVGDEVIKGFAQC